MENGLMPRCSRCNNVSDFTIVDKKTLACDYCCRIVYEKKVNKTKNKNTNLKKILRQFNTVNVYLLNRLSEEITEKDPKTISKILRKKGIKDYVTYFQFLNKINNIHFELTFDDEENIKKIFNRYISLNKGNVHLKSLMPMIFKYLGIKFCIEPEYSQEFLNAVNGGANPLS